MNHDGTASIGDGNDKGHLSAPPEGNSSLLPSSPDSLSRRPGARSIAGLCHRPEGLPMPHFMTRGPHMMAMVLTGSRFLRSSTAGTRPAWHCQPVVSAGSISSRFYHSLTPPHERVDLTLPLAAHSTMPADRRDTRAYGDALDQASSSSEPETYVGDSAHPSLPLRPKSRCSRITSAGSPMGGMGVASASTILRISFSPAASPYCSARVVR